MSIHAEGLPREDRGPVLTCVHPDHDGQCQEEAAWHVWYAGAMTYTYSCHEHLIARLQDVRYSIVQAKRTPRWEPYDRPDPKVTAARALCYELFYVPDGFAARDPVRRIERHGYVWDGERWRYDLDEAHRRGQSVDYGRTP